MKLFGILLVGAALGACGDDASPAEVKADTEVVATETIAPDTEIVATETIEPDTEIVATETIAPDTEIVATETIDADTEVAETDVVDVDDGLAARFALIGSVQIVEVYSDGRGEVAGSWVLPDLRSGQSPMLYVERAASASCRVWTLSENACAQPCQSGTVCDALGTCAAAPEAASAGALTVTGLVVSPLTAEPGQFGYTFAPEPPGDGLFDAGDAITVRAAGDAIAAFEATVNGVADLHLSSTGLVEMVDGADSTVAWRPAGDGSEIEMVLQAGWHGGPPTGIIVCRAPDSTGEIVIPANVVEAFPYLGLIGLFQNPSWIERVARTIVNTAQGPIEITASSRAGLGVSHAARDQP